MKKSHSILAAAVLISGSMLAGGTVLPSAIAEPTAAPSPYAPTIIPDRISLNAMENGETSQSVTWRTSTDITEPVVEFSPDTANPWGFSKTTVNATTEVINPDGGYEQAYHTATMTGLKPGTTYLYRVGGGGQWSAWMPFTTSDPNAERTSLIAMGDIQTGIKEGWSRTVDAADDDRPDAKALLTVGDQVNKYENDSQWHELLEAADSTSREMQWHAAVGNHEYLSTNSGKVSQQYMAQWEPPANGPTDFPHFDETVYYADVDNVRVVTLNTYYRIPLEKADEQRWLDAQATWLEDVLANNPREFTIVKMHYPIYSGTPDRGNPQLRETIQPILEKYDVDLVLGGHDHTYNSGQRDINAGKQDGPLYANSSSSIRQYPLELKDWYDNGATPITAYSSRQTYQLIDVEGSTMTYTAKDSTGVVTDQWVIEHRPNGKKKVRNTESIGVPN